MVSSYDLIMFNTFKILYAFSRHKERKKHKKRKPNAEEQKLQEDEEKDTATHGGWWRATKIEQFKGTGSIVDLSVFSTA